jgi:hypothetical protein
MPLKQTKKYLGFADYRQIAEKIWDDPDIDRSLNCCVWLFTDSGRKSTGAGGVSPPLKPRR